MAQQPSTNPGRDQMEGVEVGVGALPRRQLRQLPDAETAGVDSGVMFGTAQPRRLL